MANAIAPELGVHRRHERIARSRPRPRNAARTVRRICVLLVLPAALLLGCTTPPQGPSGVITAPTTFTVHAATPGAVPSGSTYLCYSGNTPLELRTLDIAFGRLDWTPLLGGGGTHIVWSSDDSTGIDQVTDVLPPGCGRLTLAGWREESEPYTGPSSVTVWITVPS